MTNSKVKVLAVSALALASSFFTTAPEVMAAKKEPQQENNRICVGFQRPEGEDDHPKLRMISFAGVTFMQKATNGTASDMPPFKLTPATIDLNGEAINLERRMKICNWSLRVGHKEGSPDNQQKVDQIVVPDDSFAQLTLDSEFGDGMFDGSPYEHLPYPHFSVTTVVGENILLITKDQRNNGDYYAHVLPAEGDISAALCKTYDKAKDVLGKCSRVKPIVERDYIRHYGATLFKLTDMYGAELVGKGGLNKDFGDNAKWAAPKEREKSQFEAAKIRNRQLQNLNIVLKAK